VADDWRGFDAALAVAGPRPRPVLSFDHRGLGRSGGTAPSSTRNMATDVLGLVAKVLTPTRVQRVSPVLPQARRVHVLGASMGGALLCVLFQPVSACVALLALSASVVL
jgi:pimeloyl-ACP methyl ester carboxylesterase